MQLVTEMGIEHYSNPLGHTSQFTMCGNCFRADMYRNCNFGCSYCFANNRQGKFKVVDQVANTELIRKWFYEAITKGEKNNVKKEMINNRVPIHLGGMADPFQDREQQFKASLNFLKISKDYNYPVNISTKVSTLPDEYFDILDNKIHTFQISLIGFSEQYVRKFESKTPSPNDRIAFIKMLKDKGFWVSIRIQPLIDIQEALTLITETDKYVDCYTVEHLKIPADNTAMFNNLCGKLTDYRIPLIPKGREWEFDNKVKFENLQTIKAHTKVKIGCGDNDFHTMSGSLNCCGIDTMPEAFSNWFKYNSMYIKMTGDRNQWYPKNNCNSCFNSTCIKEGFTTMKQYTDDYYRNLYGDDNQGRLF